MFITSAATLEQLPVGNRPQVALVGRSNVGKSSLVNALAGQRQLAKVSAEPGRTRTMNVFQIEGTYFLIDLPGYGFARKSAATRTQFEELIMTYLRDEKRLAFVYNVVDARLGPTRLDEEMIAYLKTARIPFGIILNKTDKVTRSAIAQLVKKLEVQYPGVSVFEHSTKDVAARARIKQAIADTIRLRV